MPRSIARDLMEFSRTASPDEERLLELYRRSPGAVRCQLLTGLSRLHLCPFFHPDGRKDDRVLFDWTHLHEETEEALRDLCPKHHLGEVCLAFDSLAILWRSAWGDIAPVILGLSCHDGQRADELYEAVLKHCAAEWRGDVRFTRHDALALIEEWREAALQHIFATHHDDPGR